MHSPLLALAWLVWWRYRWGLAACAAGWLFAAALALVLPREVWWAAEPGGKPSPVVAILVLGPFLPSLVYIICAFSYTSQEPLETRESSFPARLFTLPVPTATLVLGPMVHGTAAVLAFWAGWAVTVFWPAGMDVPLVWPALLTAAMLAWLQVVLWWPMPLPYLRLLTALLVPFVALVPMCGLKYELPPALWVSALAALVPAAYAVAYAGVVRARRGDTPEWTWPARLFARLASWLPRRRTAFRSPTEAQVWLEWWQRGLAFPFLAGMLLVAWVPVALLGERALDNVASKELTPALVAAVGLLTKPGVLLAGLLAMPPMLAGLVGADLGDMRLKGGDPAGQKSGCSPFLALLPMTGGDLVRAKLRMAARATLTVWALVLAVALAWLGATGKWRVLADAPVLQGPSALAVAAGLAAGLAGLVLATWLVLVSGLWIGLAGRQWLSALVAVAASLCWVPLGLFGYWLSQHPDVLAALVAALPYVAVGALVVKLILAVWLGRALLVHELLRPRGLALATAAWVVAVVSLIVLLSRLVPQEQASLRSVALGVALVLPLNRFAAAPLALEWNRHR